LIVRLQLLFSIVAALTWTAELLADPVENVRSRQTEPIAIRGGVMLLPLEASSGSDHWPRSTELYTADGDTIRGDVIWIHRVPARLDRRWTDDPRGLGIRMVAPEDDVRTISPLLGEGPHLAARLPVEGQGSLKLGKQTIKPKWIDPPVLRPPSANDAPEFLAEGESLAMSSAPYLPDPHSPFEYWRWVLLAWRLNVDAPPPNVESEAGAMAAEYFSGLWMMGLARLQRVDAPTVERLIDMLTRTCAASGGGTTVAAWVADPRAVTALLDRFVDLNRSDEAVARDARQWMESQPPVVIWPHAQFGPTVHLAAITLSDEPVLASFRWEGTSDGSTVVRLEPSVMTHVVVERSAMPRANVHGMTPPPEPPNQTLVVSAGRHEMRLDFGPRTIEARPPGVLFGSLNAPITLAEAQSRLVGRRPLPVEWITSAQLRRLSGRWEVFIECLRPRSALAETSTAIVPQNRSPDAKLQSLEDLRGIEAVTLLLGNESDDRGDEHNERVWLTIPEGGWQQLVHGRNDGTLQVHRRTMEDRWFCRVVLPESWVPLPDRGPLRIALVRSHGDSDQLETSPGISTPWNATPARAFIDLSHWDDLAPAR
jgi:hypothetical protein